MKNNNYISVLNKLNFEKNDLKNIKNKLHFIEKGLIIIFGNCGSGKTTILNNFFNEINYNNKIKINDVFKLDEINNKNDLIEIINLLEKDFLVIATINTISDDIFNEFKNLKIDEKDIEFIKNQKQLFINCKYYKKEKNKLL